MNEQNSETTSQQILIEPENHLPEITINELPESIRAAAQAMGWSGLMPVQATAIPYLTANRDMIVQSRTGSGKTGAFIIPLLMKIDPGLSRTQALVLVPTRELASQVYREFEALSVGMDVRGALVYGGVGYGSQLQSLREGAHVVIGTPGRVLDHLGRRSLSLHDLQVVVFDEADEMLSMGFYPAMRELRRYLPRERRSWMFSATMPYKVQSLASEFLHKPEFLSLSAGSESVSTAEHRFCVVPPMEKDIMLMRLIEIENPESAIIFCNMKTEVEFLAAALQNNGYSAEPLSGDLDQKARERAMSRIRRREIRFLVATDVAARGIDISDLSHVFQHDVPKDPEIYVHRAGRTARAGNTGVVITLVANMSEKSDLKKITRKYSVDFVEFTVPTEEEVEQRVVERLTVLLEDRYRLTTRNERDRMKRFEGLAKSLAENDDERVLLTMLLDEVYHNEFHVVAPPAQAAEPEPQPKPRSQPQPQPQSQPRAETQPRGGEGQPQSGDAPDNGGEGGEKKKKKRRRRPRGRKEGGEQEGVAQEGGEQEAGEQEGSEQEGSTQEVGGQEGE